MKLFYFRSAKMLGPSHTAGSQKDHIEAASTSYSFIPKFSFLLVTWLAKR